jgi:hypothetical protein
MVIDSVLYRSLSDALESRKRFLSRCTLRGATYWSSVHVAWSVNSPWAPLGQFSPLQNPVNPRPVIVPATFIPVI